MKKFIVIWIGQLISNIGSGMTAFAVGMLIGSVIIGVLDIRGIGFMPIIAGIIMLVLAFIFSSKKNIYEIEGSIR